MLTGPVDGYRSCKKKRVKGTVCGEVFTLTNQDEQGGKISS